MKLFNHVLIIALFLAFVVACSSPQSGLNWSNADISSKDVNRILVQKLGAKGYSPIVRLIEDNKTFCSAAVISDTLALTAAHCVQGMMGYRTDAIAIGNEQDQIITSATVLNATPTLDFALLQGDFSKFRKMRAVGTASELFHTPKNNLVSCGYPMNGDLTCSKVVITGQYLFNMRGVGNLFQGMSGGPLFDLDSLTIVGVNSAVDLEGAAIYGSLINLFQAFSLEPPTTSQGE